MDCNLLLIKNELDNLLFDIKNNELIEKNDIINKLENILNLIETNSKKSKPNPIILQPEKYNYGIKTNQEIESKKLDNFLNEKKITQEQLILTHERNLDSLPIDNVINININRTDNQSEETYWSPIGSDLNYIQMKKFD